MLIRLLAYCLQNYFVTNTLLANLYMTCFLFDVKFWQLDHVFASGGSRQGSGLPPPQFSPSPPSHTFQGMYICMMVFDDRLSRCDEIGIVP